MEERNRKMTPRQWLSWFATYYLRLTIVVLVVVGAILSIIVTMHKNSREILFSGAIVNVMLSDEGKEYLRTGLLAYLGGDAKKEQVGLTDDLYIDYETEGYDQLSYANYMRLAAEVAAADIDYLILTEDALRYSQLEDGYVDLEDILSKEMLTELSDAILTVVMEDETYRAVIDLSKTAFPGHCGTAEAPCYLIFLKNGKHLERAEDFVRYLAL